MAAGISLGTWTMVKGEDGEDLCDYPSTNSRAQSGHHGPAETCNHAVLFSSSTVETLWFRLLYEHIVTTRRNALRLQESVYGKWNLCTCRILFLGAADEPTLIANDSVGIISSYNE